MPRETINAFDVIREELPKWWAEKQQADLREGLGYIVPKDAVDLGLMIAGGPLAKLRKLGVGLAAAGAADEAQAGIYGGLSKAPSVIARMVRDLAEAARGADKKAAVEFAVSGHDPRAIIRGAERSVPTEMLSRQPGAYNVHTHGYGETDMPSAKDWSEWATMPRQKMLGVVRPDKEGDLTALLINPKKSTLPTKTDLADLERQVFRQNRNLAADLGERYADVEYPAGTWKWLLDNAASNNIDLYLEGITRPYELRPSALVGGMSPVERNDYLNFLRSETDKALSGSPAAARFLKNYQKGDAFGANYEEINKLLRYRDIYGDEAPRLLKKYGVSDFDKFLQERAPRLEMPLDVYRAEAESSANRLSPKTGVQKGYVSTSIDPNIEEALSAYMSQYGRYPTTRITLPKDTPVVAPNIFPDLEYQKEILLPRGGAMSGPSTERIYSYTPAENLARGGLAQMKRCHCG